MCHLEAMMIYQTEFSGSPAHFKIVRRIFFHEPAHMHQSFELVVNLSGEIRYTVDNSDYVLREHDAILVFPNQLHQIESEECDCILCTFSAELVSAYSSPLDGKIPCDNRFVLEPHRMALLEQLKTESPMEEIKGMLYLICAYFDRTAHYRTMKTGGGSMLLDQIFQYVAANFKSDCTVEALAHATGYSCNYLSRYFMSNVGISYHSYVNQYRLEHACHLLCNTNEPILQCALDCGFSSLRSFNRNFKLRFGITPSEYRESMAVVSEPAAILP